MYGPLRGDVQLRILVFQITFSTADRLERSGKSVVPPSFALPIPAIAHTLTLAASLGNNETINNHPNSSISFELY